MSKDWFEIKCKQYANFFPPISVILQYYENIILESVYQYLKDNGYNVANAVLCFDGIMIPKNENNNQALLDNLNQYVLEKTGFDIRFDWKPMKKPVFTKQKCNISTDSNNDTDELPPIDIDNTDDNIAEVFKYFYGDKFIFVKNKFYHFNGDFWVYDSERYIISSFIAKNLYLKLDNILAQKISEQYSDALKKLKNKLLNIKNDTKIKCIINRLKAHLNNDDIILDNNPYIIVFRNGVFDLKTFEFRKSSPHEYITNILCTGYDFEPINDTLMVDFKSQYIDKVFINPEDDKLVFFKLVSTALLGKRYKKYIIANGSGDNAKTGFIRLLETALGGYAMKINVKNLCVGKKDTFSLSNLDKMRLVYCEEPDSKTDKFDGNFIKSLTGSNTESFRKLYSSITKISIFCLLCILCNKKPPINAFDDAIRNRTIDFPFLSTFTDTDINNVDRFEGNEYYDTNEFRNKYKLTLFHFLLPYLKLFYLDQQKIKLTANLKKRRDQYLLDSDEFYCWFFDTYEIIEDDSSYMTMKSLYTNFKYSNYYQNLTKNNKRSMTKTRFEEELLSRKDIKKLHRHRWQPFIDGKQKNIKNCLINIKLKDDECSINDSDNETD